MAGMPFIDLQNATMNDRFDESQRGDVKNWLNSRYWQLWNEEEWAFRYATDLVTVTSGSQTVGSLPADFGDVRSFQRGDGTSLRSLDPVAFNRTYYDARATYTGLPEAYTVIDGAVFVGPASSETAADYQLVYEREYTKLVADGEIPAIPEGAELALVYGASAMGLQLQNDYTWQFQEELYQSELATMRRSYLRDRRDSNPQYAADPLGDY